VVHGGGQGLPAISLMENTPMELPFPPRAQVKYKGYSKVDLCHHFKGSHMADPAAAFLAVSFQILNYITPCRL
jgi:hypothetical protein